MPSSLNSFDPPDGRQFRIVAVLKSSFANSWAYAFLRIPPLAALNKRMLTTPHIKERLSLAYVHAVTGRAGINVYSPSFHDYGVDLMLRSIGRYRGKFVETGVPVDVQLKATSDWKFEGEHVVYEMDAAAYNSAVARPEGSPLYIFVMCLPHDEANWVASSEAEIVLRHCCYWLRLSGPETDNTRSVMVRIPRQQILTVASVNEIMSAARGELVA